MTEKRFELAYEKGSWWAVRDGIITLWKEEVVGLLNKLNDENEQLRRLVEEAEDIILCQTTPHYQRQWENIKKNVKGDVE